VKHYERWKIVLIVLLIGLSIALYALRWFAFPDEAVRNEMWRFLVGDAAFLFVQIAFVTLLVDQLLNARERAAMLQKLNMVIGAFYSEVGTELMGMIASYDAGFDAIRQFVVVKHSWTVQDYASAKQHLREYAWKVETKDCDLYALKARLAEEKSFFLSLLANQSLLEHETFSELLWAVTHLTEELEARQSLTDLPSSDARHIASDINRAYVLLVSEWLDYMRHLQTQYPYLFSLAVRLNPLDPDAHVTVDA